MREVQVLVLTAVFAAGLHAQTPAAQPRPSLPNPDSTVRRYLELIVERDGFSPTQFADLHSDAYACEQEKFGDAISSYWLAAARPLRFAWRADTLRAVLELVTVAAQEPSTTSAYGSVVSARVRTDTLEHKLVPSASGTAWQLCGLLSNGYTLGSYGRPDNIEYRPRGTTRASLLGTVDSLRRRSDERRPNEELNLTAHRSEAAGSLRSPAAFMMKRRRLTPARYTAHTPLASF